MKKSIIIAGISGQDGSILAEKLSNNYKIIGLTRKKIPNKKLVKIDKKILLIKTDYTYKSLFKIIKKYKPIEIYNFACQSNPSLSWVKINETSFSIVNITINFLEIIRKHFKKIKYFNASSCEIFKRKTTKHSEYDEIFPNNPYGISKSFAHFLTIAYRKKFNLFLVNGILFNHESLRRNKIYLGKKLITEAHELFKKKRSKIVLNDTSAIRDFSYAYDIINGIIEVMRLNKSDDFIIASGKSRSVRDFAKVIFNELNIPLNKLKSLNNKGKDFRGANISKILHKTKWKPKLNFESFIKQMIRDYKKINSSN